MGKKKDKKTKKKLKKLSKKVVAAADISATAARMIALVDKLELEMEDAADKRQDTLAAIVEELGAASFEHAQKGPTSILFRNGRYFTKATPGQG